MGRAKIRKKFDETTEAWLGTQKKHTETAYAHQWKFFEEFTGKSGAEILASRKNDKDFYWESQVIAFRTWLEKKGFSPYSARAGAGAARSFFSYYRLPLMLRRQDATKITTAKRVTEDYRFILTDLAKMDEVGNLEEKYIVRAGKSFGLRAGDFLKITRGDLEAYIDREPPISIGQFETTKESAPAFPFIDSDLQPIAKAILEKMTRDGKTKPDDRILDYKNEIQLSRALRRLADKAGIEHGNKIVRFHCLRKFLIDHLSDFMSESKWKQIVGKKIAESAYVSTDNLRADYRRAMAETTFTKIAATSEDARKEALLAIAKTLGYEDAKIEHMRAAFRSGELNIDEEEKALKAEMDRIRRSHLETDGGVTPQQQASNEFAKILLDALRKVKAEGV
jgi:integrase